ncbi:MAG: sporulation transcription factor Spo0A [Clostridia bacterium]|nr:sporulation transcription factor Spo0A [Clostridia bacterium]
MNKIRVMLADDNLSILNLLTDYFSRKDDIEVVAAVSDGMEIPEAVREFLPDILVMDIIMPRRDGFMTLEKLAEFEAPVRPKVIVLTGLARDDFIVRAIQLGASYYMVKPFDMELLYSRIREIAGQQTAGAVSESPETSPRGESVEEQITNLFLTLGIPAHIKGYQYLREAVRMVIDDHGVINRITKELYPGIARKYDTSASKVERAMRHAIEVAWNRGRLDTVNQMYGHKVFRKDDKPTNGEFISCVAEKIQRAKSA